MRILPGVLKELVKHVPAVLFQTVEWTELAAELPKISKRMISKEGYRVIFFAHQSYLSPSEIDLTFEPLKKIPIPVHHNQWLAQKWLHLYFTQLLSPHGLFLDLRSQNFAVNHPQLRWHPTGLWVKFADEFRLGLINVYDGFYMEKDELFIQGLSQIGLLSFDWPQADQQKLCQLFRAQFETAKDGEMRFNLDEFREAMMKLADFLLKKKVTITKDFLYLGINLVTLYSSMEETNEMVPVKKIYLQVRDQYQSKIS